GDDFEDRRRPALLLPPARHRPGGGGGADRQRLLQGGAPAAADGIRGRSAEAGRDQFGRERGMTGTVTLYRTVGTKEVALIEASGFRAFPPRLPDQPIFYPVTNEAYATQIARDWNTKSGDRIGFVTRFAVESAFLAGYDRKIVGGREHEEYWIPA